MAEQIVFPKERLVRVEWRKEGNKRWTLVREVPEADAPAVEAMANEIWPHGETQVVPVE